jgi:DNA-binding transcriptional regulator/RsmH inhibitor MraZ
VIDLVTRNAATDAWYDGMDEFNFATGEAKAPKVEERNKAFQQFSRMMWAGATKVGFATSGRFVIARYCKDKIADF